MFGSLGNMGEGVSLDDPGIKPGSELEVGYDVRSYKDKNHVAADLGCLLPNHGLIQSEKANETKKKGATWVFCGCEWFKVIDEQLQSGKGGRPVYCIHYRRCFRGCSSTLGRCDSGKFPSRVPYVGRLYTLVDKIWTMGDKTVLVEVFVVDSTTVKFRIKNANARSRVLRWGMWNLCGVPVVVYKWGPKVEENEPLIIVGQDKAGSSEVFLIKGLERFWLH